MQQIATCGKLFADPPPRKKRKGETGAESGGCRTFQKFRVHAVPRVGSVPKETGGNTLTDRRSEQYRQHSLRRLRAVLTSSFERAQLLTLRYAPGQTVPLAVADRQYRTFMGQARSLVGKPIRYVVMTEYTPSDARIAAYQLVTDLPSEICRETADSWFMGETSVVLVDAQQLAGFAAGLMAQPVDQRQKGRRYWRTSRGLSQKCGSVPAHPNTKAPANLGEQRQY